MGVLTVRPFFEYIIMEIPSQNRAPEQVTEDEQNCQEVGYSVSSITNYSISSPDGWVSASTGDSGTDVSVSNNTSPWVTTNPPVMEDRGAVITLIQADSGRRIDIGVHQSGKGYIEKYGLSGEPSYEKNVRASEAYVNVTWKEEKLWQADTLPSGPWNPFPDRKIDTFTRTVSLGGMNKSSATTRTANFEFTSERGVVVSGSVIQDKNKFTSGVTDFDSDSSSLKPDKIFWGVSQWYQWFVFDKPFEATAEDVMVYTLNTAVSKLKLSFKPITTFIWEVYNEEYISGKTSSTFKTLYFNRPYDDTLDIDDNNDRIELAQGYGFLDTVDDSLYEPAKFIARAQYMDAYVHHDYKYYPRLVIRDFKCSVVFKEETADGSVIDAQNNDWGLNVDVHHAIICNSDYSGNTRPSELIFYQLDSVEISAGDTGDTTSIDGSVSFRWPNGGDTSFSYEWRRRYFYGFPEGKQVDMKKNAEVVRLDSEFVVTADTTVANGYYRIELSGTEGYTYTVKVTDYQDREITAETGKTMDSAGTTVISNSMSWYPCQVVLETQVDGTQTISTERTITFTITRKFSG